jgi:hypothetical protein
MYNSKTLLAALLLTALLLAAHSLAGFGPGHAGCRCPDCGHMKICEPIPEVQKEKRHCWCVDYKDICIPGIKCLWDRSCEPKCGKVITVKKLRNVEYECEKCGYKWEVRCVGCEPCAPCTQ